MKKFIVGVISLLSVIPLSRANGLLEWDTVPFILAAGAAAYLFSRLVCLIAGEKDLVQAKSKRGLPGALTSYPNLVALATAVFAMLMSITEV